MAFVTGLGVRVEKAAAAIPQNAAQHLFVVTGAVLITYILGRVTIDIAGGANNSNLEHDTTPTVLCDVLDIDGLLADTRFHISGDPLEPMRAVTLAIGAAPGGLLGGLAAGAGLIANGIVALTGNIDLRCAAVAGTGSTAWVAYYLPLETGSILVSA